MNRIAAVVAGLSLAFVGTSITIAATINVPGDYPTIQEAINASSDGDTIQLVQGVYTENINTNGTSITIQGTVVDGSPETIVYRLTDGQPVFVISGGSPTLRGLQILPFPGTFGDEISEPGDCSCGVTIKWEATPTIDNCYISGHPDGGIFMDNSNGTITNCTISGNGNTANYFGGGICLFSSNPTISGCTISGNTANEGGGIYCDGSLPTITDCTISGNTANGNENGGGGISCNYVSNPTITGCHITDNRLTGSFAFAGAGISSIDNSNPHLINCTISGNTNWVDLPANIGGQVTQGLRGEESDLGTIILEDSTVCGTGEYNITGVLIEHRGENHISDCIDDGDVNGDGDVDTNDLDSLHASLGICPHDIDHDGDTDVEDLLRFLDGYGTTCP